MTPQYKAVILPRKRSRLGNFNVKGQSISEITHKFNDNDDKKQYSRNNWQHANGQNQ